MDGRDPHAVLNLPRNFTLEQLRYNYKVLARQLHPDKCGSRISREQANATFQLLTESYRLLLQDCTARDNDKPFETMRGAASGSASAFANPNIAKDAAKNFSLDRFNSVFETNRMDEPVNDAGYGNWMTKNDPNRGISRADANSNRQLIKYTDPAPVTVSRRGCVEYSELGLERVDDYSRGDATRHGIQYTDYRIAHTTSRLVDESVNEGRKEFRTIDELQQHRATVSYDMNESEAQSYAERKRAEEDAEEKRQRLQSGYDRRMQAHFERVHQSLLGFSGTATI